MAAAMTLVAFASILNLPDLSTQHEVKAEVEINAPAELVWRMLTDFSSYSLWNPYIYPARGEVRPGAQLELTLRSGDTSLTYNPIVQTVQPNRELSWSDRMVLGSLERIQTFTITPLDAHRVRLESRELFRGILLPFHNGLVDSAAQGLDQMNKALRTRAELWNLGAGGSR